MCVCLCLYLIDFPDRNPGVRDVPGDLSKLVKICWETRPAKRPTAAGVHKVCACLNSFLFLSLCFALLLLCVCVCVILHLVRAMCVCA